jgi:hypothetical protein
VRLNSGPAAVEPVDIGIIGQTPAVFNLIEVKTWLSLVISVVG